MIPEQKITEYQKLKKNWEGLAQEDAMWAILSVPEKKGNKWDQEEFFATGRHNAKEAIDILNEYGISLNNESLLDFGCGIGRMTQGFAPYFDKLTGIDISEEMISKATILNKFESKCSYIVNSNPDLSIFENESFSFIYSYIVLQHIPTQMATDYVEEFCRIAKPGGIILMQLPENLKNTDSLLVSEHGYPTMDMFGIKQHVVLKLAQDRGCRVVDVREDGWAGKDFNSFRYILEKAR